MTNAQIAGRVAGIAYVHTRRTVALIDWAEVAAIVLHGLQVLIALTVLAGQMTRRAWDALPALSEQLGKWYATALADGCTGLHTWYHFKAPGREPHYGRRPNGESHHQRDQRSAGNASRRLDCSSAIKWSVACLLG